MYNKIRARKSFFFKRGFPIINYLSFIKKKMKEKLFSVLYAAVKNIHRRDVELKE